MTDNIFESLKQFDEQNFEFWYARDLQQILEYAEWRNFVKVIEKAIESCKVSGNIPENHFVEVNKMVQIGSGALRELSDMKLTRYACYLIVQNGDPSKPVIASGQSYFAIQTRRQELSDDEFFRSLGEEKQRLILRQQLKEHNTDLAAAAKNAGIAKPVEYAVFQNYGYKGLYGGLDNSAIRNRKGLKKNQHILDYMNSSELAANLFRATQTEEKLRRDNIQGKAEANQVHFQVGSKVRKTIEELGGVMPENQPTPTKSIQQIEREQKKLEKDNFAKSIQETQTLTKETLLSNPNFPSNWHEWANQPVVTVDMILDEASKYDIDLS